MIKLRLNKSPQTNVREKMKGRFRLRMSPHLSSPQKIEKYAQEPLAFHLYKNRHFMNKISLPKLKKNAGNITKQPYKPNSFSTERPSVSINRESSKSVKKIRRMRNKMSSEKRQSEGKATL